MARSVCIHPIQFYLSAPQKRMSRTKAPACMYKSHTIFMPKRRSRRENLLIVLNSNTPTPLHPSNVLRQPYPLPTTQRGLYSPTSAPKSSVDSVLLAHYYLSETSSHDARSTTLYPITYYYFSVPCLYPCLAPPCPCLCPCRNTARDYAAAMANLSTAKPSATLAASVSAFFSTRAQSSAQQTTASVTLQPNS